ncbi:MAG: glycosyltransferase family 9 protein [Anaerolineae bacterium]
MKFLIVKTSAIGDVLHAFPIIDYLMQRFPSAHIDWVVEKASYPLLQSHPSIHRAFLIDTKKWRRSLLSKKTWQEIREFRKALRKTTYDAVFDLQGNCKSALMTWFARSKDKVGFGWHSVAEKPNLFVTRLRFDVAKDQNVRLRYLALLQQYFKDQTLDGFCDQKVELRIQQEEIHQLLAILQLPTFKQRPCLMVAFGSRWPNKRLDQKILEDFLTRIAACFKTSFLFIYADEKEQEEAYLLQKAFASHSASVGMLSLPLLQRALASVDGLIAMDSAVLHLGAAAGVPTFSVFGPSSAAHYKPIGERHRAFSGQCPYGQTFITRCPKLRTCSTGACMQGVSAHELFESFREFWQALQN